MLAILGPSKTIDMSPHKITGQYTRPEFLKNSEILVKHIRTYSPARLKSLMLVSDKLAELNFERYAAWKPDYKLSDGNHALLSFSGEVFNGLQARSFNEDDLLFAQNHIRLLSGLYGVLRPLDSILPYRLEMGTKLKVSRHTNLYSFWKGLIPGNIIESTGQSGTEVLINLASNEYFKAIMPAKFPYRIITPIFKEHDGKGFRNVTVYAKKARGQMLRFMILKRITDPENLKAFDSDGYYFNAEMSEENEWWFCR